MRIFRLVLIGSIFLSSCSNKSHKEDTSPALPPGLTPNKEIIRLTEELGKEPTAALYHARALELFKEGVYQMAMLDMQKAIGLDSAKPEYYLTLADIYFTTNLTRKAKENLEKCLTIDKDNKEANMKLAELYLYVKQHQGSIHHIDEVLKKDVRNPKAYFIKGMNFKEMFDTARAISSFQTVIEQDPEYYDAYMQLGVLYSMKKNDLAFQYLNTALKLDPKSTEALYARAMHNQNKKDYENALKDYEEISKIDPANRNAYYNRGYIYFTEKDYNKAIDEFTKAVNVDPNYPEALYMRGMCYKNLKQKEKAVRDFKESLQVNPVFELSKEQLKTISN